MKKDIEVDTCIFSLHCLLTCTDLSHVADSSDTSSSLIVYAFWQNHTMGWHTANSVYFRVWHSGSRTNRCVSGRHPSVDVDTPPQAQWGQDWAVLPSRAGIIHARPLRLLTTLRCQWVGWQGTWPRQSSHCGLMPYMNLNGFVHIATHLMV